MTINHEFRKQVKDVLEHLYDTAYLESHPFLSQITLAETANRVTRAQKLRSLIKDLIESLRPQEGSPSNSAEWRCYRALRYHYVQGMGNKQVEIELGISLRQLQREFHKGIEALAVLLWDLHTDSQEPALLTSEADEVDELQEELNQWVIQRSDCELKVLLDDLNWMLKPILEPGKTRLQINLPDVLPQVYVDATLTRQAIFTLIRLAIQQEPEAIDVTARFSERTVDLLILFCQPGLNQQEADWRIAEMLISQQGGSLTQSQTALETEAEIVETSINLSLPRPEQGVVLVTDDNQALHQLFERYLAPFRFTILHAYNGQEALSLAQERHPDFITLDVMMASMDGWQVLRELQENLATSDIPVIVCSVLKEPQLALSLGARAYLKKPVERLQLQETLEELRLAGSGPARTPEEPPLSN